MRKRTLGLVCAGVMVVAGLVPGAAWGFAPGQATVTVTCTSGFVLVVDANAAGGVAKAVAEFNVHNPTGVTCSL